MNLQSFTDDQLLRRYRLALKAAADDERARTEGELRNRGLIASKLAPSRPAPTESHFVQLAATRIRAAACKAYNAFFSAAEAQGKSREVAHEIAAMNVLVSRLRDCEPNTDIDEQVLEIIAIEFAPFKEFFPNIGHIAIVEYAVWREYPTLANEGLISHLVKNLKVTLNPQLLASLDGAPFPWVRFLHQ